LRFSVLGCFGATGPGREAVANDLCISRMLQAYNISALNMPNPLESLQIEQDVSRAWTLPAEFYFDADVFAAEKGVIFSRTWQVVGHRDQVKNAGDYFTTELVDEPLLIVRGGDGKLRGFYNVCRHRAGPPAEGCGSRKLFRCGYHGWTYGLDGALLSATEIDGVEGFRPEDFALVPLRVEELFNFIFVNLDPGAHPLRGSLGELTQQIERVPITGMKLFERRSYEMNCNWKTYVDNYLEGYHLPSVHPGLKRELDYNAYMVEAYAGHVRQFSPIRGAQPGDTSPRRYQEAREDLTTDYFWIFPNWMLNCYPDNVSLNLVLPVAPERSLAIFEWYLPEKDHGSSAAKASVEFSEQIQLEDVTICEKVQKNLRSRSYSRGRFSVQQEKGVHAFHRIYAETMKKS
jgi:phenylpropionate dioxygenase-like ring-hydroxylating dioxygenase large terminal subunit